MSERLLEHYETKYAGADHASTSVATLRATPRDRFEGTVATMHKHFRGGDILEVGGGDGIIPRSLIAMDMPFDSYTLTDLSPTRASASAASISDPRVKGFALDIEKGSSELGMYDAIIMIALIEHLIDPMGAMRVIRKMLKPGGFAYIDTPNIAKYTRRIKLALGQFPSTASKDEGLTTYDGGAVDMYDEGHLHYWTYGSMERMLTRYCGFTSVERRPYPVGNRAPAILAKAWPAMFSDVSVIAR
ncbi:MAG: class I SAM-dependent methyltransferase [Caulobacteraceae bacterium]